MKAALEIAAALLETYQELNNIHAKREGINWERERALRAQVTALLWVLGGDSKLTEG